MEIRSANHGTYRLGTKQYPEVPRTGEGKLNRRHLAYSNRPLGFDVWGSRAVGRGGSAGIASAGGEEEDSGE